MFHQARMNLCSSRCNLMFCTNWYEMSSFITLKNYWQLYIKKCDYSDKFAAICPFFYIFDVSISNATSSAFLVFLSACFCLSFGPSVLPFLCLRNHLSARQYVCPRQRQTSLCISDHTTPTHTHPLNHPPTSSAEARLNNKVARLIHLKWCGIRAWKEMG